MNTDNLHFANPEYFYLLLVLIPVAVWYYYKINDSHASLRLSSLRTFATIPVSKTTYIRYLPYVIKVFIIILLVTALARPQSTTSMENATKEGIDIVLAMDISSSMLAMDFEPNRMEASKDVAQKFIAARKNDRIGLVLFSGESFTQCPLTADHTTLINLLQQTRQGVLADGTAIGLGLTNAVARLKDSETKSKVIILLTDGVNNTGNIAPLTGADIAATYGIRVYTIGVGKNGYATMPVTNPFGGIDYQDVEVQIDESTLTEISNRTEGKYFRATDNFELLEIYKEIDRLEKTRMEVETINKSNDEFQLFALIAMLLIILNFILRFTVLRTIP